MAPWRCYGEYGPSVGSVIALLTIPWAPQTARKKQLLHPHYRGNPTIYQAFSGRQSTWMYVLFWAFLTKTVEVTEMGFSNMCCITSFWPHTWLQRWTALHTFQGAPHWVELSKCATVLLQTAYYKSATSPSPKCARITYNRKSGT